MSDKLFQYLTQFYHIEEFPALAAQAEKWKISRPLANKVIYDATPVFRNTMVKYYALQCAGAQVIAAADDNIPCDENICKILPEFGIKVAGTAEKCLTYDAVADCAGVSRKVKSRNGYVELTRSGLEYYRDWKQPVFSADSGVLKKLETILGTGDGFLRAMTQLGYDDFKNKKVLVFGGGKVGRGIAMYGRHAGAAVEIVEFSSSGVALPPEVGCVEAGDPAAVASAVASADFIVSATGRAGALMTGISSCPFTVAG